MGLSLGTRRGAEKAEVRRVRLEKRVEKCILEL